MTVKVMCNYSCSVPQVGIIANLGEVREVDEDVAQILVGTGKFDVVEASEADTTDDSVLVPPVVKQKELIDLANLGPKSVRSLNEAGVHSIEDLISADPEVLAEQIAMKVSRIQEWQAEATSIIVVTEK